MTFYWKVRPKSAETRYFRRNRLFWPKIVFWPTHRKGKKLKHRNRNTETETGWNFRTKPNRNCFGLPTTCLFVFLLFPPSYQRFWLTSWLILHFLCLLPTVLSWLKVENASLDLISFMLHSPTPPETHPVNRKCIFQIYCYLRSLGGSNGNF